MIDFNKPLSTRTGKAAKLLHTMPAGQMPYNRVVLVTDSRGHEELCRYTEDGKEFISKVSPGDLQNSPEFEYKLIYEYGVTCPAGPWSWFKSKAEASTYNTHGRVGWLVRQVGKTKAVIESL